MEKTESPQKKENVLPQENGHITLIIISLVICAFSIIFARMWFQETDHFPAGDRVWAVTLKADIHAPEAGALIRIAPPWDTRHARLYGQKLSHPGMRHRRTKQDLTNRDIVLVATQTGSLQIEVLFDIHISQITRAEPSRPKLLEKNRAIWLSSATGIPVNSVQATSIIDSLKQDMPDTPVLVNRIFEYVSEKTLIRTNASNDGAVALEQGRASSLGAHKALVSLLRTAHLPARLITGLNLSGTGIKHTAIWAEVYYEKTWHPLNVESGHFDQLPPGYVPVRKGSEHFLEAENAQLRDIKWEIASSAPPRGLFVSDTPRFTDIFDLTRLNTISREVLSLLLLLPLGALSTVFLRQIIGIRTYGTFSATLLALAAVFVDWITALITFTLVTIMGVVGRAMMPALGLSRVPRLSIVFTSVAMIMVLVVSMLSYMELSVDGGVILLPIVILTTLVDSIYSVADERGVRIALFRLGWTVAAALIALVILLQNEWGAWILSYPEVHAITIALIIFTGHYQGRKLVSLKYFSWMKEPSSKKIVKQVNTDDT